VGSGTLRPIRLIRAASGFADSAFVRVICRQLLGRSEMQGDSRS
jgi:hypothetical protein